MFSGQTPERQTVLNWAKQGHIKPDDVERALALSQASPSNNQWLDFTAKLLLWLSAVALAAGVIFFFAFNWQSISNLTKFVTLQSTIVLAGVVYSRLDHHSISGISCITLITLLTGALLALVGQIYQTGADPWQLFAIWAVFTLPWAIIHRASTVWMIFITLVNLALYLYSETFRGLFGFLFRSEDLTSIFLAINTAFILILEFGYRFNQRLIKNRFAIQITLFFAGSLATWLAMWSIFDFDDFHWGGLFYLIWISIAFYYYRHCQLDLFVLSGVATSLIITASSLLIKTFGDAFDGGAFLVISLAIIGMSTAAGIWLKNLYQVQKQERSAQDD